MEPARAIAPPVAAPSRRQRELRRQSAADRLPCEAVVDLQRTDAARHAIGVGIGLRGPGTFVQEDAVVIQQRAAGVVDVGQRPIEVDTERK